MATILIVEDDVFIREMAELMIEDWGHHILSAGDMGEALVHLRAPQHIDAMFTDVYLRADVHGGCDLAHMALKLRPALRILYTTGNRVTEGLQALFAEGSHFLKKPYTGDQLQDCVETMLAA
jgi:CheY-like chemotaxis protein